MILAEYPGYGPRGGSVGENSLVDDAEQVIALAHRLHGLPVLVIGERSTAVHQPSPTWHRAMHLAWKNAVLASPLPSRT